MSLLIMGYMGSGKSSHSKRLANRLKLPHYDLDQEVEKLANASITEIFEKSGEPVFRSLECHTLEKLLGEGEMVLALGGGTPCFMDNLSLIKEKSFTVYLKLKPKVAFKRLKNAKIGRPLIADKSDDELLDFITKEIEAREEFYTQADITVDADKIKAATLDEIKIQYLLWLEEKLQLK